MNRQDAKGAKFGKGFLPPEEGELEKDNHGILGIHGRALGLGAGVLGDAGEWETRVRNSSRLWDEGEAPGDFRLVPGSLLP